MKQQSKTIQKKAFIGILCSVILIFLDQFTKYLAVQHLKDQMPVVLWKNVLELSYLENRGALPRLECNGSSRSTVSLL